MKRAAVLLVIISIMVPALAHPEDITLFKHAYRKTAPPPPPPPNSFPRYRVKQGDTLKKIFLKDFGARPEELPSLFRKFRQYNPGVRDLNRIARGNQLTIPAEPRGQARKQTTAQAQIPTGNVIVIKKGQHLAKALREMYGLSNDAIFRDYIEKIKKLNPDIEDLNLLVEGQKVKLPAIAPSPRTVAQKPDVQEKPKPAEPEKAKKLRIVQIQGDAQGQTVTREGEAPVTPAPEKKQEEPVAAAPVTAPVPAPASAPAPAPKAAKEQPAPSIVSPVAMDPKAQQAQDAAAAEMTRAQQARERENIEVVQGSLLPAFGQMGARQRAQGTYFLPVAGDKLVSIDTGEVPIIDLDKGRRIIVDVNNKISPETRKLIEQAYPSTRIISGPLADKTTLMERILDACGYFSVNRDSGPVLAGEDEKIRLFGKWVIYKDKSRRGVIVINALSSEDYAIPGEIRDYALRFGIKVVEMGGKGNAPQKAPAGGIRSLGRSYEKLFGIMGVAFEKNKELNLVSLEAVKITYTAPMLVGKTIITSDMPDRTMLDILRKTGYRVVDAKEESLADVLEALSLKKLGPPVRVVIARGRAELDLPAVQVGDTTILEHPVDKDIVKFLTTTGVKAIVW